MLAALAGGDEDAVHCAQWYDDVEVPYTDKDGKPSVNPKTGKSTKKRGEPNRAGWKYDTFQNLMPFLAEKNKGQSGICIMVNVGNGEGRSIEHVAALRAIVLDFDEGKAETPVDKDGLLEVLAGHNIVPTFVVTTSSPQNNQVWLVFEKLIAATHDNVELYLNVMRRLQSLFARWGADANCAKDITRIFRLPGFLHQKNPAEPKEVRLTHRSESRFTLKHLDAVAPPLPLKPEVVQKAETSLRTIERAPLASFKNKPTRPKAEAWWPETDTDERMVDTAINYVLELDESIEGEDGSRAFFIASLKVCTNFPSLSREQHIRVMRVYSQEMCHPAWDNETEFLHKIEGARVAYLANRGGGKHGCDEYDECNDYDDFDGDDFDGDSGGKKKRRKATDYIVGANLTVIGKARQPDGTNVVYVIEYTLDDDKDGTARRVPVPLEVLHSTREGVCAFLNKAAGIETLPGGKNLIASYIIKQASYTGQTAVLLNEFGYHHVKFANFDGTVRVRPDASLVPADAPVIVGPHVFGKKTKSYKPTGSPEKNREFWDLCRGNPVMIGVAVWGFSGAVTQITGTQSALLWLHGESGTFKTGLQRCALSRYAPNERGDLISFGDTASSFEVDQFTRNGGLAAFDDATKSEAKGYRDNLMTLPYTFANSSGRGRAVYEAGEVKKAEKLTFTLAGIGTSEHNFSDLVNISGGHGARLIPIELHKDTVFKDVHGKSDARELGDYLNRELLVNNWGFDGFTYDVAITEVSRRMGHAALKEDMVRKMQIARQSAAAFVREYYGADESGLGIDLERVLDVFASAGATAYYLTEWGVIPLTHEEAFGGIMELLRLYIEQRGGSESTEAMNFKARLVDFIQRSWHLHFRPKNKHGLQEREMREALGENYERVPIKSDCGFVMPRRVADGQFVFDFFITTRGLQEALTGTSIPPKRLSVHLEKSGLIDLPSERKQGGSQTQERKPGGEGKVNGWTINGERLRECGVVFAPPLDGADDDGEAQQPPSESANIMPLHPCTNISA